MRQQPGPLQHRDGGGGRGAVPVLLPAQHPAGRGALHALARVCALRCALPLRALVSFFSPGRIHDSFIIECLLSDMEDETLRRRSFPSQVASGSGMYCYTSSLACLQGPNVSAPAETVFALHNPRAQTRMINQPPTPPPASCRSQPLPLPRRAAPRPTRAWSSAPPAPRARRPAPPRSRRGRARSTSRWGRCPTARARGPLFEALCGRMEASLLGSFS